MICFLLSISSLPIAPLFLLSLVLQDCGFSFPTGFGSAFALFPTGRALQDAIFPGLPNVFGELDLVSFFFRLFPLVPSHLTPAWLTSLFPWRPGPFDFDETSHPICDPLLPALRHRPFRSFLPPFVPTQYLFVLFFEIDHPFFFVVVVWG